MSAPASPVKPSAGPNAAQGTPKRSGGESGSALVLVLIFMIVGGLIVGALMDAITNDLRNSSNFAAARSLQYDATSATDLAIQSIRYTPLLSPTQTLNASPPAPCWSSGPNSTYSGADNQAIAVWCSTAWSPTSADSRVVTLSACPTAITASACAFNPTLQAVVTFDDYPANLAARTPAACVVYCGTAMTINNWVRSPILPTVSGISLTQSGASPASGPITGNTQVTIAGSGFVVGGTTASFVEESGGVPLNANVVLPATGVVVNSSSSITVVTPSVTVGTTYFLTVTTPTGTSAYGSSVFTYVPVAPTVTAISSGGALNVATGSTAGGSAVSITGTGFLSGATVNFVQESGGVASTPSVILPATYAAVVSNSLMTAVSPPVTSGTTYFVTVTTPAGTSTSSTVFTYQALTPIVASISPSTGPIAGASTVTLTGSNFFVGATVNFVAGTPSSPGASLLATNVVVVSATSITADSPAAPSGAYFITVTTPNVGTSSNDPVYTYQ